MPQQHLDRLSPIDASFLLQEGRVAHMHVGGLTVFDGPPIARAELVDQIRSRLHLVPRYRHKLAYTPFDRARPVWIDDPCFDVERHVREAVLAAPGDAGELYELTARVFSERLDRSRPLWEAWLVTGLEDDRFAVICKTHHALVDGVGGVDLAMVLLDLTRDRHPLPEGARAWRPRPAPGAAALLAADARGFVRTGRHVTARVARASVHPRRSLRAGLDVAEGFGEVAWAGLNPAPPTPINVPIGPDRRFAGVCGSLDEFKLIKNAFATTVNDVVLSVVTGALRKLLHSRHVPTRGLQLRALVPVSIRAADERHDAGNRLAAMRGPLPVYISDPVERLRYVARAMDELKGSKQALAVEALTSIERLMPPALLTYASRMNFSSHLFNLLVTNIPGPQFPLYLLGRELRRVFPLAFLPRRQALAIAIISYNGQVNFGLLGDYDALEDIDAVAESITQELATLVALARASAAAEAAGAAHAEVNGAHLLGPHDVPSAST